MLNKTLAQNNTNSDVDAAPSTTEVEQVVQFLDEGPQAQTTFNTQTDVHDFDGDTDMDTTLGSWLSRPLEISTVTWNSGTSPLGFINPWSLFMEDPRNVNKIAYYRSFRCKHLCLKFIVNGGPFTYGRMLFYYTPMTGSGVAPYKDKLSYNVGVAPNSVDTAASATHRPFIMIDPTRSQGGCFELPFIWPYNWVDIPSAEWGDLGQLSWIALTRLSNAGGAAGVNVSIKIFAWLVDPVFSVPTSSLPTLPAQSSAGDEYVGMLSKPASAIANMAGKLADVPIIGGYARATQIGAGAAAGVAKMLGFSRPTILSDIEPMRPTYVSDMATCDRSDFVLKLTTDSKQELSISPAIFGVGENDELSIAAIAGRETYIGQCTWSTSAAEGTILASMPVTPNHYVVTAPSGYTLTKVFLPSAAAFASWPFKYWRGNVKFRFQVVASQFHRGRVKIVYDPIAAPIATKTNALYSRIVDIQETTDFTIVVGWNSLKAMLEVENGSTLGTTSTFLPNGLSYTPTAAAHNGALTVFVENELMIPIPGVSADITLLCWVSMEDPVFNFPVSKIVGSITPSPPFVASVGLEPPLQQFNVGDMTKVEDLNNVYFGETISSFRTLLKRYSPYMFNTFVGLSATYPSLAYWNFRALPLLPGSDADGVHTTSTAVKTNYVRLSYMQYISLAYSCFRGGVKYKYHIIPPAGVTNGSQAYVTTNDSTVTTVAGTSTALSAAFNTNQVSAGLNTAISTNCQGYAYTSTEQNPFIETEVPFWTNAKFRNPKAFSSNSTSLATEGLTIVFPLIISTGRFNVATYYAASEDYTLGFYTGPPAFWSASYNVYS